MFDTLLATLVSGITLASIYALMSIGLTVSWGTLKIFNFFHGGFILTGAYVAWYTLLPNQPHSATGFAYPGLGSNYIVASILVCLVCFLLGVIIQRGAIHPLLGNPSFSLLTMITTLGAYMIMQGSILLLFGGRYKILPPLFPGQLNVGSIVITYQKLSIILISMGLLSFLHFFLKKTKPGMAMRAIEQDRDAALLAGINAKKVFLYTLGLSGVFAGISGMLIGNLQFITPTIGMVPLFKSFIIIIMGGLGSMRGNIVAAIIIGLLEAFVSLFLGIFWVLPIEFLVMMSILFIRPSGLFGVKEIAR